MRVIDDIQGINWINKTVNRSQFREIRMSNYVNYTTLEPTLPSNAITYPTIDPCNTIYKFHSTQLHSPPSCIPHFQLRHLCWAPSKNDVYYASEEGIQHWCPVSQSTSLVLDTIEYGIEKSSCMIARHGFLIVGGFRGEYVLKRLNTGENCTTQGVFTSDPNGIINHLDSQISSSGSHLLSISNNDSIWRLACIQPHSISVYKSVTFPWSINCSCISPDSKQVCIVGDCTDSLVIDIDSGKTLHTLKGHTDYSFSTSWSPCGRFVVTGNQDLTARIYDVRFPSTSLSVIQGVMSGFRSLKFNSDGSLLFMSESVDYMHIVDMKCLDSNLNLGINCDDRDEEENKRIQGQSIDFFGDVAGFDVCPDDSHLYIAVSESVYGALMDFELNV